MTFLDTMSALCGVVYLVSWSASFLPQCHLNYTRQSVSGLSFEFIILNIIGYAAYSVFNCVLYFNKAVQTEYIARNGPPIPVDWSDVAFALWGCSITLVTIGQCFYYPSGGQVPAVWAVVVGVLLVAVADVAFLVCGLRLTSLDWLDFCYVLSYVKLFVTASKYIPQAVLNYRRKSTVGWSIVNILLDFNGGMFSFLQQSVDAYQAQTWNVFTKNPVKFGLSFLSVGFDVLFMLQHYVWYTDRRDPELRRREREDASTDPLTASM